MKRNVKDNPRVHSFFCSHHIMKKKVIDDNREVVLKYTAYPSSKTIEYHAKVYIYGLRLVTKNYKTMKEAISEAIAILRSRL